MRIGLYADPLGFADRRNGQRYLEMKSWLSALIRREPLNFDEDMAPAKLLRSHADLYVADLYSLKPLRDDLNSKLSIILNNCLARPASLHVFWSAFTAQRLKVDERLGVRASYCPNLLFRCSDFFEFPDPDFDQSVLNWYANFAAVAAH